MVLSKYGRTIHYLNINKGVNQFVDIVTTRHLLSAAEILYPTMANQSAGTDILYPQIKLTPFRYEEIFRGKGTFRFTVQVTSANANPKIIRLVLDWNGVWNKFNVRHG